jgi:DNA-binding IclR family transcriptional regulator
MRDDTGNLQSVRRAISALEEISDAGEVGVTELGRRLGVHKATASRLVATLADRGLVERDPATEKYRLGFGLIRLAGAAMASLDIVRTAHPVLEELAERTSETVNLGVLAGDGVVYIDQVAGTRSIVAVSWVGRRTPLHCTSNGKVLLAHMEPAARAEHLAGPLEAVTPRTIVDPGVLAAQLDDVVRRGYAQTIEELEEGLNAVAAPVRQADGAVVAAVSVSGPAFRLRPMDMPRVARWVMDAADAIGRRMGYVERR